MEVPNLLKSKEEWYPCCFALLWCKCASQWDSRGNFMERLKKSALFWNHIHCMHRSSQKRQGLKAAITFMQAFKKYTWFAVFIGWHCLMSMWVEMQQICHSLPDWEWNRQYRHANHSIDQWFSFPEALNALPNDEAPLCRFFLYLMRRCEYSCLCLRLTRCRA